MTHQENQIKESVSAYIIAINNPKDAMNTHRYSVYLQGIMGRQLKVLWPNVDPVTLKNEPLLDHQVSTERRQYPKYHFALSGCGYSKEYEIAQTLQAINPELDVYSINGHMPRLVSAGEALTV